MHNQSNFLLALLVLLTACPAPGEPPPAPDPIGDELLRTESVFGLEACRRAHLYRNGRSLQYQCFTLDGSFSWENRGTLSPDGAAALDAELASADFDDTEPGDFMGLCQSAEADAATLTVWIGERSVSYSPLCPTKGLESLNELLWMLRGDISECEQLELLDSVEPGCRAY
ncbi:MAG TPA: hypothetical protein VK034_16310 [Enhygromyxa sp.]|nr:hypothetical protein [Enhygromyxa sp.]